MPVIGPNSAAKLREFVDHPEPPMPTESWCESQIAGMSLMSHKARSDIETKMLVDIYVPIMLEHSQPDLTYAINHIMRKNIFFPAQAEIVALAEFAKGRRDAKKYRAKALIFKHEMEWQKPIPDDQLISPDDVKKLLSEFKIEPKEPQKASA